jgi:hypothetical protein
MMPRQLLPIPHTLGPVYARFWPCNAHIWVQNVLVMGTLCALQAQIVHNMGPKCVVASSFAREND